MTNSEKKRIIILAFIAIVIIIVIMIFTNRKKQETAQTETPGNAQENVAIEDNLQSNEAVGGNIQDDVTPNETTSNQGDTERIVDGINVNEVQISFNDPLVMTGIAKNISNSATGGFNIDVVLLDKSGKELAAITTYLPVLQPGEETKLESTNAKNNISNPKDLEKITVRKHVN